MNVIHAINEGCLRGSRSPRSPRLDFFFFFGVLVLDRGVLECVNVFNEEINEPNEVCGRWKTERIRHDRHTGYQAHRLGNTEGRPINKERKKCFCILLPTTTQLLNSCFLGLRSFSLNRLVWHA